MKYKYYISSQINKIKESFTKEKIAIVINFFLIYIMIGNLQLLKKQKVVF